MKDHKIDYIWAYSNKNFLIRKNINVLVQSYRILIQIKFASVFQRDWLWENLRARLKQFSSDWTRGSSFSYIGRRNKERLVISI